MKKVRKNFENSINLPRKSINPLQRFIHHKPVAWEQIASEVNENGEFHNIRVYIYNSELQLIFTSTHIIIKLLGLCHMIRVSVEM